MLIRIILILLKCLLLVHLYLCLVLCRVSLVLGIGRIGKGSSWARTGAFAGKGALAGAAIGTAVGLYRRGRERSANEFYNRRLDYAQRQARRREKADWKANMTQRDGYSY